MTRFTHSADAPRAAHASFPFTSVLLIAAALVVGLGYPATAQAQVVEVDPDFPVTDEPVTIYFNADEGTGGLAGYDGDVYAHTGVFTSESPSEWTCVKNEWPTSETFTGNREDTRLERVSEDRYRLRIEDLRAYYNDNETGCTLGEGETIQSINFVFRSADGDLEGKAAGGNDILIEVADGSQGDPAVNVRIEAPQVGPLSPLVTQRDTTVTVEVLAQAQGGATLDAIRLRVNGTEVASSSQSPLTYDFSLDMPGDFTVEAVAEAGSLSETTRFRAVRAAATERAPLPAGVEDGINHTGGGVTLVLRAPGKDFAHVIGGFSDWEVRSENQMKLANAGTERARFWLELNSLPSGQQPFQYLVEGEDRLGDPYSKKVLTPNDQFIGSGAYSDLEAYPEGQTTDLVSVLRPDEYDYDFSATGYERPAQKDLVIYELLVRDFVEAHDYETIADSLDYLDDLGVTAIELMPVSEFDGNESWGYNPSFHLAADKYYGPAEDLKRLIDMAHERGMAVILDVVYNHATGQSPLVALYNEGRYGPPTEENIWLNPQERHPFNVFNDFNHESQSTQYWLDRANRHWLTEFNVDGFRFDLSKGFTQGPEPNGYTDVGNWSSYDAERIALLKRMADQIWATDDEAYVILEHFAENREEDELVQYRRNEGLPGMMVWSNLNEAYSESAMGYASSGGSDFSSSYAPNKGLPVTGAVTYMESHDEQWMMYRNIAFGNSSESYDVTNFETAFNRQKLVGAFFFTVPGPRMIWQFGELGYGWGEAGDECLRPNDCPAVAPERTGPKPIRFAEYYNDPDRRRLYETWSALLRLRAENAVFTDPSTNVEMNVGGGNAARSIRLLPSNDGEMQVLIVGNFGVEAAETEVRFPEAGTWHDFFPGGRLDIANPDTSFAYAPGEFHVYTSEPVFTPEAGIVPFGATRPSGNNPLAGTPVTLAEARTAGAGREVLVEAVVTRVAGDRVYLQEQSGGEASALAVASGRVASAVQSGDRVRVSGRLASSGGTLVIGGGGQNVFYSVIARNTDTPGAQRLSLAELAADPEAYESELVRVERLVIAEAAGGTFAAGERYAVETENGSASFSLHVPEGSFYAGRDIPEAPFDFEGVVTQESDDADGYALVAAQEGDLTELEVFEAPTSVTTQINQTFGDASQTVNYRLVALPGRTDRRVGSGVDGTAGEDWRAFWDTGAEGSGSDDGVPDYLISYEAGDGQFAYAPGRGFWMIADSPREISGTFSTVSLAQDNSYAIDLHDGWNIISNPFGEDVSWSTVQAENGTSQPLWNWNHGSGSYRRDGTFATAQEGEAFYFFNNTGADELVLPYPGAPGAAPAALAEDRSEPVARLTLTATSGDARLGRIVTGTRAGAEDGMDRFDQPAPPSPFAGGALHLSAPQGAAGRAGAWAADFRAPGAEGYAYDLVLHAPAGRSVMLAASGLGDAFAGQEVRLVEQTTARTHDLRRDEARLHPAAGGQPLHLTLLVGSASYVERQIEEATPEEATLHALYPNPLRAGSRATITYALPEAADVRLEIFDALGRRVQTLVDARRDASFHEVPFSSGGLSSGVYFYRLTAEGTESTFTDSGQFVLVR